MVFLGIAVLISGVVLLSLKSSAKSATDPYTVSSNGRGHSSTTGRCGRGGCTAGSGGRGGGCTTSGGGYSGGGSGGGGTEEGVDGSSCGGGASSRGGGGVGSSVGGGRGSGSVTLGSGSTWSASITDVDETDEDLRALLG